MGRLIGNIVHGRLIYGSMPWTLYRHILKELVKLLIMSLFVLVVVISVAVAIRPLTKGQLDAWTLIKFVGLSCPTILDIALPFASAFASTLVFHRMISDNEIVACRASGMSYRMVFAPVAFLGLVLTVLMFLLSSWVIPQFSRLAATMIQTDAIKLVVNELRENHVFKQGDHVIFADQVQEMKLEPGDLGTEGQGLDHLKLVMLKGVAFGQLDNDGRLRSDTTAERADLVLYNKDDQSWVTLRLHNTTHYSGLSKDPWGEAGHAEYAVAIPNPFKNKLRFLSASDLRGIEAHPEGFKDIERVKTALCARLTERAIFDQVLQKFSTSQDGISSGTITLLGMTDEYQYVIHAAGVKQIATRNIQLLASDSQPIVIDFYLGGVSNTRYKTDFAVLELDFDEDVLNMQLELGQCEVTDLRKREGHVTQHAKMPPLKALRWPDTTQGPLMDVLMKRSIFELQDIVSQRYGNDSEVVYIAQAVHAELVKMGWNIMTLRHQRAASSMGCLLVLLLGAMMTCYMQGRTPLVVYFWSFSLAAIAVIITRSSENIIDDPELSRFISTTLIWSGNLLVLGILCALGMKISKPRP